MKDEEFKCRGFESVKLKVKSEKSECKGIKGQKTVSGFKLIDNRLIPGHLAISILLPCKRTLTGGQKGTNCKVKGHELQGKKLCIEIQKNVLTPLTTGYNSF